MHKQVYLILILLLISNIVAFSIVSKLFSDNLEVVFVNVGEGDSIFITTPHNYQIIIDGGPNNLLVEKISNYMPFADRDIDLMILTHPDKDHFFGLIEILQRYKISNILWTGEEKDTPQFKKWLQAAKEEDANMFILNRGDMIHTLSCDFEIVNSFNGYSSSNDNSIVLKLIFNENEFLFTGDISGQVEKDLLNFDLCADVLKISHHGSKYSTTSAFLEKVSPQIAVIQVGENSYGHPSEEVLTRLSNFGIKVLRTDKNNDIKILSNGEDLVIK